MSSLGRVGVDLEPARCLKCSGSREGGLRTTLQKLVSPTPPLRAASSPPHILCRTHKAEASLGISRNAPVERAPQVVQIRIKLARGTVHRLGRGEQSLGAAKKVTK